jgi:phospholipid/cholesterol/gamma-HCH transport system substrate-binding protein
MVTQAPRRSAVAIAVAFTLSCVGLIIFVWTQFGGTIPFAPAGYRIQAVFPETGLLVPGEDVRIAGVTIGRVVAVSARGTSSLVRMDIDQQYAPVPRDTRAILRSKTLLGEAYIELSTGTRTAPKLADGATIPRSQIQPSQALDRVLNSFDTPTQHNLQALLLGLGASLKGRGQYLNDAFGNFDPAVTELSQVVDLLNGQQGNLKALIGNGGSVLQTLGSRGSELRSLITAGEQVMSATAQRNAQLTATVGAMPPFLSQLRQTLRTLNTTLGIARPSLDALAPVAPLLTPALRGLLRLSGPAIDLLGSAPHVLRAALVALPAVRRFTLAFRPATDQLYAAALQLAPVIELAAEYRRELLAGMSNLSAMLEAGGPAGVPANAVPANVPRGTAKYLRALITIGSDSAYGQSTESPGERSNTYFSPGELRFLNKGGLLASSCANTSNTAQFPVGTANVPCRLQPQYPYGHGIPQRYYPRVKAARP